MGETARDVTVIGYKDEEKTSKVRLETSSLKEGLITAALAKETFIQPKGVGNISLTYTLLPSEENGFVWQKKILSKHTPESLQIKINPVENLGYKPEAKGFGLTKSEREQGWYISQMLSPKVGGVYSLALAKEGEKPAPSEEEKWPDTTLEKLNKLILDNLAIAFLVNNAFIFFLIFLLPWLAKRMKIPRIK